MKDKAKKFASVVRKYVPAAGVAVVVAASTAGAEGQTFDIGAAGIATTAGATILGIAAAGAGLKATGIGIKVAFKWAERLLKG